MEHIANMFRICYIYSYMVNNYKSGTLTLSNSKNIVQNHSLRNNMNDLYQVSFFFSDIYDSLEPFNTSLSIFVTKDTNK